MQCSENIPNVPHSVVGQGLWNQSLEKQLFELKPAEEICGVWEADGESKALQRPGLIKRSSLDSPCFASTRSLALEDLEGISMPLRRRLQTACGQKWEEQANQTSQSLKDVGLTGLHPTQCVD